MPLLEMSMLRRDGCALPVSFCSEDLAGRKFEGLEVGQAPNYCFGGGQTVATVSSCYNGSLPYHSDGLKTKKSRRNKGGRNDSVTSWFGVKNCYPTLIRVLVRFIQQAPPPL